MKHCVEPLLRELSPQLSLSEQEQMKTNIAMLNTNLNVNSDLTHVCMSIKIMNFSNNKNTLQSSILSMSWMNVSYMP